MRFNMAAFWVCLATLAGLEASFASSSSLTSLDPAADTQLISGEFCELQTLNASCRPADEVVVMETALYGRMRLGSCVIADLGFVGCSRDVLSVLDARCSGRRRCTIRVPDEDLASIRPQPCLTELKSYLEASYRCQKGTGLLASVVTVETGCGGPDCPWLVQVADGQRINITLVNFARPDDTDDEEPDIDSDRLDCKVYATIKEVSSTRVTKTVCKSVAREQHVYTSQTSAVEIRVVGLSPSTDQFFLLRHEAVGCVDPPVTLADESGMWFHRYGDTARVGCNSTRRTWTLHCRDNQWIGDVGSCSGGMPWHVSLGAVQIGDFTPPLAASVVIIMAVAACVGAVILAIGLCLVKRHYGQTRTQNSYRSVTVRGADGYQLQAPSLAADNYRTSGSGKYKRDEATYESRRLPGHRRDSTTSRDSCSLFYGDGQVDRDGYTHIWERPLPGAPQSRHVTTAAVLVPVGDSCGGSVLPNDSSSRSAGLVYACRGAPHGQLPPPPPLPDTNSLTPSPSHDAMVTSSGELSNYYQLDAKDNDQSP